MAEKPKPWIVVKFHRNIPIVTPDVDIKLFSTKEEASLEQKKTLQNLGQYVGCSISEVDIDNPDKLRFIHILRSDDGIFSACDCKEEGIECTHDWNKQRQPYINVDGASDVGDLQCGDLGCYGTSWCYYDGFHYVYRVKRKSIYEPLDPKTAELVQDDMLDEFIGVGQEIKELREEREELQKFLLDLYQTPCCAVINKTLMRYPKLKERLFDEERTLQDIAKKPTYHGEDKKK